MIGFKVSRFILCSFFCCFLSGFSFSNSLLLEAQNIGGGQKQIDATKTYSGLSIGMDYVFSFDILAVNKPIQISDGTTTLVVNSPGSYSIGFTTTTTTQVITFFHQSSGQPAKLELDDVVLTKIEETTITECISQSDADYRYSFQGQEKDDEIKGIGNSLEYRYRVYDSRLGKFLSIDPLFKSYAWNSPYAFCENRVIDGVDLEGLEYVSYTITVVDGQTTEISKVMDYELKNEGTKGPGLEYNYVYKDADGKVIKTDNQFQKANRYGIFGGERNPMIPRIGSDPDNKDDYEADYELPGMDEYDEIFKRHDQDYDEVGAAGPESVMEDVETIPADKKLLVGLEKLKKNRKSGGNDKVTGEKYKVKGKIFAAGTKFYFKRALRKKKKIVEASIESGTE